MKMLQKYFAALKHVTLAIVLLVAGISIIHFPFGVDAPLTREEIDAARRYYTEAYRKPVAKNEGESEYDTRYTEVARIEANAFRIKEQVAEFVKRYNLDDRPVLEIGSGRGYLQDLTHDYTGLDISPSAARFYHKKFVVGSATAMPFSDNSFDGVWSIWVFEHVPNPEQAFSEARRVTRDKGVLFLLPAWNVTSWAAEGYEVRPYSDFHLWGRIVKASIPLRSSAVFLNAALAPNRLVRSLAARYGPTRLRYHRLKPNYEKYWVPDSDAVNSIDSYEALLWFLSRGDECLNCNGASIFLPATSVPLIIRVHKPAA
jgi:SAM-dependent methyltransferase